MSIGKTILTFSFIMAINFSAHAQELQKSICRYTKGCDSLSGYYEYSAPDKYMIIKLWLYTNNTFHFTLSSFNSDLQSDGTWAEKDSVLVLNSDLNAENIPVILSYRDTSIKINKFKINMIRNLKGEEMPDALVAINNKAIQCIPSYGICNNDFNSIDSIKVYFESGPSSKWLRIDNRSFTEIIPTVAVDVLISNYMFFKDRKFQVLKSSIKPIK